MTTDTIRPSKAWLVLKVAVLLACLFFGLKFLESFLVYSFQAGGLHGSSAYQSGYEVARAGQLLTLAAFIASQLVGGAVLRTVFGGDSMSWGTRVKSVLLFSIGFSLLTGLVIAVLAVMR